MRDINPESSFVMAYVSEGMKLEEDIWYVVRAPDRVLAYAKLWKHLRDEDDEFYKDVGFTAFAEDYEVMFEFDGTLQRRTAGLTICEVI